MSNIISGNLGYKGQNAYEIAVENGYEGTLQEWLDSLDLAISDTLSSSSTNSTASGSKAVYDYIDNKTSNIIDEDSTNNTFTTSKAVYDCIKKEASNSCITLKRTTDVSRTCIPEGSNMAYLPFDSETKYGNKLRLKNGDVNLYDDVSGAMLARKVLISAHIVNKSNLPSTSDFEVGLIDSGGELFYSIDGNQKYYDIPPILVEAETDGHHVVLPIIGIGVFSREESDLTFVMGKDSYLTVQVIE